jgi:hypothetical protein
MKRWMLGAILASLLQFAGPPVTLEAQQGNGSQPGAPAQQAAPEQQADLAKKLTNPVSDLVSVPFQFNWEQNVGPADDTRFVLNIQPVVPFSITTDWNMIARVIMPLVSQPPLFEAGTPEFGVSDVLASFFFSPKASALIWGVGPAVSLPSTSIPTIGTGKWSAGPTVVVLKQAGPWTVGALWNQVWSFAGSASRDDVNQMFLQPFLAYQATHTLTLTVQSESTANWEVDDDRWTVPINVIVAKLSTFGVFPASYQVGFGGFPVHPAIGPSWKVRGAIVILLPRQPQR